MRVFLSTLLWLYATLLVAQPGSPGRRIRIGLFDAFGKALDSTGKSYRVSFTATSGKQPQVKQQRNHYDLVLGNDDTLRLRVQETGTQRTMTVMTNGSLDSLAFSEGHYTITGPACMLFCIRTYNTRLYGQSLAYFKTGLPQRPPVFWLEEDEEEEQHDRARDCYQLARALEKQHGGHNWIRNVCNDEFETYTHSVDTAIQERIAALESGRTKHNRVQVYPYLHQMYIRHVFTAVYPYTHTFSLSTDGCITWKPLFRITGEWYVHLVYFPGSNSLGIDVSNSRLVLLSTGGFTAWKYYTMADWDEEPPVCRQKAFIFKNAGWMEDVMGRYYFSE